MITHGRGYLFGIEDDNENLHIGEEILLVAEDEGDEVKNKNIIERCLMA